MRDQDDVWVPMSALLAQTDVLVRGDKDLIDVRRYVEPMRILSPREFWKLLRQAPA